MDTAYAQLCAEGYIESKPKRGFFVCQVEELAELTFQLRSKKRKKKYDQRRYHTTFSSAGVDMEQFHIISGENCKVMINDNSELFKREFSRRFGIAQSDHIIKDNPECSCIASRS